MPFAADGKLFYRTTGTGGNTAVFLHCAAGSGLLFGNQFQAFRNQAQCFFVDLPGHGASPRLPTDSTIRTYADSVVDFIRELNRPVDLLGHSMGGAIALEFALSNPELLRRLILVATGCRFPDSGEILKWLEENYDSGLDRIARNCFSDSVDANLLQTSRSQMARTDPEIVRADFLACSLFNRCDRLQEIRVPTLVICGEDDRMAPVELSRQLADSIPNARLELIPRGSHLVMLEQPERFNQLLAHL
jgi:pimeloyl-ACP methyl ester carboxylesterase